MLRNLDTLHSSGATWQSQQHSTERTLSWSVDPCGEIEVLEQSHTVEGWHYGQGE